MPGKPPLLIISRNMPPTTGGIERLMHRLSTGLCESHTCIIIGPRGCRSYLPNARAVIELPHRPAVLFVLLAFVAALFVIVRSRPAAVLAGNGLMSLSALPARFFEVPTVTMVYGLDIIARSHLYQTLCLPLIRSSSVVVACSSNSGRLAMQRGVPKERLWVITPGVDMPVHTAPENAIRRLDDGGPVLLSVGRLVRRKGVADFIRNALPLIVDRVPKLRLVVVGSPPTGALRREEPEIVRIHRAIRETGLAANVLLAGHVGDDELLAWWSIASLHIFPVIEMENDVEGFGLVALEAAAHGVPTVAFEAGGVGDAVEHDTSGKLVKVGDYPALADAVCVLLDECSTIWASRCRDFAASRSWDAYVQSMAEVLSQISGGSCQ